MREQEASFPEELRRNTRVVQRTSSQNYSSTALLARQEVRWGYAAAMPLDQQGWWRPDYRVDTSVVGVVSKVDDVGTSRSIFTTSLSPELSVWRYRAVPQSVQRESAHTTHVHFSLVRRIIPYRATASAGRRPHERTSRESIFYSADPTECAKP